VDAFNVDVCGSIYTSLTDVGGLKVSILDVTDKSPLAVQTQIARNRDEGP